MKSVIFAVIASLLVMAQVNAFSVICKEHFITKKTVSCLDFQTGDAGMRVRIVDLIGMNPTIDCSDDTKKTIEEGTKICVLPDFDRVNKTIRRLKLGKNLTCRRVTDHVGLDEDEAYILENFNRNTLVCKNIKSQVGNIIDYCTDKNYKPDFSRSKRVYK